MSTKQVLKIAVDLLMTAALLLLMAYELIGTLSHELLGAGMFLLFILHHLLNRSWLRNLFKGKYAPYRVWQTVLALLIFVTMIGSMLSGVVLSRHLFASLPIRGWRSIARTAHMLCGYWGFVLMSLHLGLHWSVIMSAVCRRRKGKPFSCPAVLVLRTAAGLTVLYGIRSFFYHDLGSYLLLRTHFAFFDFDRPAALFLLDYLCIMSAFVFLGYFIGGLLRRKSRSDKR